MLIRNGRKAFLLLAVFLIAADSRAVGQEDDPVQELRQRQQRLSSLEYAIKEAELLWRLCELSPRNPECVVNNPENHPDPPMPASSQGHHFRLVEVFGSRDRLQAVLQVPGGERRIAQTGTELAPDLIVDRIRPDAVDLLTPSGITTIRIGDE